MRTTGEAPMRAALLAGSAAAVTAALVSLPLRSPNDALLNTGSVVAGVLVLSLASGLWWRMAAVRADARRWFAGGLAVGFLVWTAVALALETQMDRMASFTVPLAAIAFGALAALTPYLSRLPAARRWVVVGAASRIGRRPRRGPREQGRRRKRALGAAAEGRRWHRPGPLAEQETEGAYPCRTRFRE